MKEQFSDAQIADFLRRSYFVVDGLWFMKAEERLGFDQAMALDEAVWDVMSKVQARKARALLGIESNGLPDLMRAFQLKLASEAYEFEVSLENGRGIITIRVCPWFEILKSSGRTQIAEVIADRICAREYTGWITEFGGEIALEFKQRLCIERDQCETCRMVFTEVEGKC